MLFRFWSVATEVLVSQYFHAGTFRWQHGPKPKIAASQAPACGPALRGEQRAAKRGCETNICALMLRTSNLCSRKCKNTTRFGRRHCQPVTHSRKTQPGTASPFRQAVSAWVATVVGHSAGRCPERVCHSLQAASLGFSVLRLRSIPLTALQPRMSVKPWPLLPIILSHDVNVQIQRQDEQRSPSTPVPAPVHPSQFVVSASADVAVHWTILRGMATLSLLAAGHDAGTA